MQQMITILGPTASGKTPLAAALAAMAALVRKSSLPTPVRSIAAWTSAQARTSRTTA